MELRHLDILLYPPALTLLLLLAAAAFRRFKKTAIGLFLLAILAQFMLGIPFIAERLYASLYTHPAIAAEELPSYNAQAIVALGAGLWHESVEYGGATLNITTLERTRYAAFIAKQTGLPVLASGGDPLGRGDAEADVMARALREEYGLTRVWAESDSKNTYENAANSVAFLRRRGIERIFLVTSGAHMQRATRTFAKHDLHIIPAPIGVFAPAAHTRLLHFIPHANALLLSTIALHEYLGAAWYQLKDAGEAPPP